MEGHGASLLSRCRQLLSRVDKSDNELPKQKTSPSWPRITRPRTSLDEDFAPLLDTSFSQQINSFSRSSSRSSGSSSRKRYSHILTVPPWCHLPSSARYTTLTLYLLLSLLLFTTTATAAPLVKTVLERQSIPDRFGNTGSGPAPAAAPLQPLDPVPSAFASSIVLVPSADQTTSTSVDVVTSATPPTTPTSSTRVLESATVGIQSLTLNSPSQTAVLTPTTLPSPNVVASTISKFTISATLSASTAPTVAVPPPPGSTTGNQLQRLTPSDPLTPATIIGITTAAAISLAIVIGIVICLYRRRKARQVEEIPIRRSKLVSRLALRMFGNHYDESIARSRKGSASSARYTEKRLTSISIITSPVLDQKPPIIQEPTWNPSSESPPRIPNPPISPSVYSPRLTRHISTTTLGSVTGWLDKSTIGRPQPVFTGTPSQLLDAPRPLFAQKRNDLLGETWVSKGEIGAPMPVRPGSAEPLGRLSGMGYGLGMGRGSGQ